MALLHNWYSRRSILTRRLILLVLALVLTGSVLVFTPTPYYVTAPGAAIDTSRLIQVEGGARHSRQLLMLVLATQPANLFWYLYARVDPRAVLETGKEFLGDVEDYDKYLELTRQMMEDSRNTAPAIALQQLGLSRGVSRAGAYITDLASDSPARGVLQKGDVVDSFLGRPVTGVDEFRAAARTVAGGTPVALRVRRGKDLLDLTVPTASHTDPSLKGTAQFGIFLKDELLFDIPVNVQIKPGAITGPSAGLMFTLQIIDQLTPGGITGGLRVAGTGTIQADGGVGVIGGVEQKVYTAEVAGANVMFVPLGNYQAARKVATRVELVPVQNVREALDWLRQHRK